MNKYQNFSPAVNLSAIKVGMFGYSKNKNVLVHL